MPMSINSWREAIPGAIEKIINAAPDENKVVLLSALYSLRERFDLNDDEAHIGKIVDFVPGSIIDELLQEKLDYFIEYSKQKRLEQVHHSELHGEYAQNALEEMLEVDLKIAKALLQTADEKEQSLIRANYKMLAGM